jgi:hypothetical protein
MPLGQKIAVTVILASNSNIHRNHDGCKVSKNSQPSIGKIEGWPVHAMLLPMLGWEFLLTLQPSWFRCMLLFEINPAEVLILIPSIGKIEGWPVHAMPRCNRIIPRFGNRGATEYILLFEINPAEVLILISDHGCAGYKCPWARRSL